MKASVNTVYSAVLNPSSDGSYEVSFSDFPGCVTFGATIEEAQEKASEVLSLWIEQLEADKQAIPKHKKRPIIIDVNIATA